MVANYVNKIGVQNIDGTYSYQDIGTDSDHIEVDATGKKLSAKLTELENATPDVATSSTPGIVKPGTGMEVDDTGALNLTYDHTLTLVKENGAVIDTYDGSVDKTISVVTIPTDHSSVNTTYGVATTGKYGHVKVVDTYQTEPGATNGTVASATALHEAYKELKAGTGIHKTQAEYNALPESEKKNGSTYYVDDGKDGTLTSDNVAYDNSVSGLSAEYVKTAIDELAVRSAKPIAHPSSIAETYGAGTGSEFGHVRLSDSYKASDGNADASVAASSYALYQAYNELNGKLAGVGTTIQQSDQTTHTTGSLTKVCRLTIPVGTWMMHAGIELANVSGPVYLRMGIAPYTRATFPNYRCNYVTGYSSSTIALSLMKAITLTKAEDWAIFVSDGTGDIYPTLEATKIAN